MRLSYILLALITASCSSQKIEQTLKAADYPEGKRPYYETWLGGAPGSSNGALLYFPASILNGADVKEAFFQGLHSTSVEYYGTDKKMMMMRFTTTPMINNDVVMDIDPVKESANKVEKKDPLPFKLENHEAVIVSTKNNRHTSIKLTGIKQKRSIVYPSMPQGGRK